MARCPRLVRVTTAEQKGDRVNTAETRKKLVALLDGPVAALGLDLEDIDLSVAGRRRVLRVAVDRDGGVSMDDIADATREISRLLDDSDALGEAPYTLEVSSPGVDRPLTLPRHWRRNIGRLVKVTTTNGSTVTGRVLESGDESARLDVNGKTRDVLFEDVAKAKVQIEFKPAATKEA